MIKIRFNKKNEIKSKIKSILFNIFLVIAILLTLNFVSAQKVPAINITLMNQEPDPVSPGRYVELRFKVFNSNADTAAENFQIMLEPIYPFSLDPNEEAVKNLGTLLGYGNSKNVQIVKYKVRVDEKAVEGSNPIIVKYKHGRMDWVSQEFYVDVQTIDANLAITSVETEPEKIKPGESAIVKIKVKNLATTPIKDITLKLDLAMSSFLSSTSLSASDKINAFNSMPFVPLGSSSEQKKSVLSSNEEYTFTYKLISYPDAESKIYKIPIQLTFYDNKGNQYTKSDIIGLVVGSKPDMSVLIEESDLYVGKKSGTVTIKIINKGFSDIKFLDIKAKDTENLQILSAKEVYVGNVDSDDYETAEFRVYTNGNLDTKKEQTIKFPLEVEYRDANNNIYRENYELDLQIINQDKLNVKRSNPLGNVILLAVVVIAGVFLYRRLRKKRN